MKAKKIKIFTVINSRLESQAFLFFPNRWQWEGGKAEKINGRGMKCQSHTSKLGAPHLGWYGK